MRVFWRSQSGKMWFLGAIFMLASVMSVHAETVLSIDFSTAQGYSDGPLLGQPAGAADVWSEEPGTVPVGFDVQNGKLHFDQHGGANSFIMISFPVTKSGMITATWEWQYLGPADSSVDNGFVLSDSSNFNLDGDDSAIDFNENGAMVRMTAASGMINAVNSDGAGAGTYADVNVDYRDGRVIPMKIEVDLDNFSYDVWADGVLVGDDFGLRRNPQNGFDTLVLWNSGSAVHALEEGMLLDDIVISTETASFVPNWSLFK